MSSLETYTRGYGMAAHNEVMTRMREEKDPDITADEPTRVWTDQDLTPDGVYESLTIVLNTGGCRWAAQGGCTMCGYVAETIEEISDDNLRSQIEAALEYESQQLDEKAKQVKVYSSGSVLDNQEVSPTIREELAETFADRERIVVESMPSYIKESRVEPFIQQGLAVDVAIGLETSSDRIRRDTINKAFDFEHFKAACQSARSAGAGVKAYLLMKPPFLTESEAIEDMIQSIQDCAEIDGCHTVSMNPTNVQRYTLVDELYYRRGYRPPWLWSVARVLKKTAEEDITVVSDPVGAGSDRGPHNCGECDTKVKRSIKDFSLRQDPSVFEQVDCGCKQVWTEVHKRETGYNQPLVQ
ncbi:archaeosine biosynthesis radical SAM protein RaSEA [Salinarchaeum sp. IM2453]|uniref:archaeosine biosynthesis radical SAM protein RaSEA n=1 Tax=Salinarchaeum sp. IM2453 TaxID=2862870 RepID=UPI001C838984|nr:archaeosine biosynthesis radical SAM protein RaSEA [Salinarchaeum sp. IM2453]QZA87649.1 archaeosine biosynthesis radical SAM protein RaSEA [Salinarchaeum sp. IM2453]